MSKQENQDKEALLSALNAYGQNFLASFNLPQASTVPKRKRRKLDNVDSYKSSDESDEDEWEGFGGESESGASDQISEDEFSENEEDLMDSEGENNEETSPYQIHLQSYFSHADSALPSKLKMTNSIVK